MSKSIEDRVDVLLEVGVKEPKKWAKRHGYSEPDGDASDFDWYVEWQRLREHHLDETSFLFEVIDELVKRCGGRTSKIV